MDLHAALSAECNLSPGRNTPVARSAAKRAFANKGKLLSRLQNVMHAARLDANARVYPYIAFPRGREKDKLRAEAPRGNYYFTSASLGESANKSLLRHTGFREPLRTREKRSLFVWGI